MAIVNFINTKAKSNYVLKKIINYVTQEEKTDEKLIGGKDIMPESAYSEMLLTKKEFNKTGGRQYLHMVQSFSPKENIDYEKAHEIALELAQHFEDFQVLVATHKDKNHVHSHFIINSVNYETGLKIQQSFKQLTEVMDKSDEICKQYGFSVLEERKFGKHISRNEYHVAMKGESWKNELINVIDDAMEVTRSKDDFIAYMNNYGYEVNWSDTRKYITYTTPDSKKCRCKRLHNEKYTKEEMERVYNRREDENKEQTECNGIFTDASYDNSARRLERNDGYALSWDNSEYEEFESSDRSGAGRNQKNDYVESKRNIGYDRPSFSEKFRNDSRSFTNNEDEFCGNEGANGESYDSFESYEYDNENTNWNASDIADFSNNFLLSLKVNDDESQHQHRTKRHTGDLSKVAKRERARKEDVNMWDEER